MRSALLWSSLVTAFLLSCGPKATPDAGGPKKHHPCGEADKVHQYDLHDDDGQDHYAPCSKDGKEDFSGMVRLDTEASGVRVSIHVSDDDVKEGKLGSDLKGRDAMIVYPKGRQAHGVEIPLVRTAHGYTGTKLIPFDDLAKLTDEGTKLDISIYDHDESHKEAPHEEVKVSVAISAGKSCEKAQDENPQTITMGKPGTKDLTAEQLGQPMKTSTFMSSCGLPDSSNADICVAVKNGKVLGVSVKVTPQNNKVAACIDKSTRRLGFPKSDKLDVVKQHF